MVSKVTIATDGMVFFNHWDVLFPAADFPGAFFLSGKLFLCSDIFVYVKLFLNLENLDAF